MMRLKVSPSNTPISMTVGGLSAVHHSGHAHLGKPDMGRG
jgi:hypothetical protein